MTASDPVFVVPTPYGAGHLLLTLDAFTPREGSRARGLVVIGHGAGGNPSAPDILVIRDILTARGFAVARSVQPYAVAGRRVPAPIPQLDEAYKLLVFAAREQLGPAAGDVPVIVGGRSNGARIACRTASAVGAAACLALSFPLHPPGRPDKSRADELRAAGVPTLVLQGERDAFGSPDDVRLAAGATGGANSPAATVHAIAGATHSPRSGEALRAAARATAEWMERFGRD